MGSGIYAIDFSVGSYRKKRGVGLRNELRMQFGRLTLASRRYYGNILIDGVVSRLSDGITLLPVWPDGYLRNDKLQDTKNEL